VRTVLITDLDNTVYDFVHVHATAFRTLLHVVSKATGISEESLKRECKMIARRYGTLDLQDYMFDLILQVPEICKGDSEALEKLQKDVRIGFDRTRKKHLQPYPGLKEVFGSLNAGGVEIIALSNAPFAITYYRLHQLGLMPYLSGLIAWAGPDLGESHANRISRLAKLKRRVNAAKASLDLVALLDIEGLKPNGRGFGVVQERFGSRASYFALGDSISKDLAPARALGASLIWARFGTILDELSIKTLLEITPWSAAELAAHSSKDLLPDFIVDKPVELLEIVPHAKQLSMF
jgi:phosphoglycolate phosphatase